MFKFSWYSVPTGIACIGFLFLSLFIYFKNRKSPINILFSVFVLMVFNWLFAYTICYSTQSDKVAYVFARIACTSVFLVAPFWYHFTAVFLKLENERKYVRWVWAFVIVFLPFFVFTPYFLDASKHYWGFYSKAGPLHPLSLVIWYFVCFRVFWLLLRNFLRKDLTSLERGQTKYMLAAYGCAAMCSLDFIQKYGVWEMYPFGWIFAIPMALFMTYAVIRYKMLEIDTVIHRTLLWFIVLVLLVLPVALLKVLARQPIEQLNNMALLVLEGAVLFLFVLY
ncbi:MAG: histidine kinase N-terminal 7TM domain-containing protein, partial [Candidatus Omnitrophota bacterium]